MEIKVNNKPVMLTIHKTLLVANRQETLHAVADYPPFQAYLGELEQSTTAGIVPNTIQIRSIQKVAQRIVCVIADVSYEGENKTTVVQTVHFSTEKPAVLLPIAVVGDKKYGIVLMQRRPALSFYPTKEAIYGSVDETGRFSSEYMNILTKIGFEASRVQSLGEKTYTIGNEGKMPYSFFTVSATLTPQQLEAIGAAESDSIRPVAVPFEVLPSLDDAKVSMAATLLS